MRLTESVQDDKFPLSRVLDLLASLTSKLFILDSIGGVVDLAHLPVGIIFSTQRRISSSPVVFSDDRAIMLEARSQKFARNDKIFSKTLEKLARAWLLFMAEGGHAERDPKLEQCVRGSGQPLLVPHRQAF